MDYTAFVCVGIAILCYAIGFCLKKANWIDDNYIPSILCASGAIFGLVAYFTGMEGFVAHDVMTALIIGVASGLSAVGANQVYKQATKGR